MRTFPDAVTAAAETDPAQLSFLHGHYAGAYDREGRFIESSRVWRGGGIPVTYPRLGAGRPEPTRTVAGRTLFAGPLFDHFGHFLLETTARLWPTFLSDFDHVLFQFPHADGYEPHSYQKTIFDRLGLLDRLILTAAPVRCEELTVPQPSIELAGSVMPEFVQVFDKVRREGWPGPKTAKIYVSRTRLHFGRTIGEAFVERAFEAAGFRTVFPEEMTTEAQIDLFRSAAHVAGIQGSGLHNLLYSDPGTQVTVIVRDESVRSTFQAIDAVRGLRSSYIDGMAELDPTMLPFHAQGPFKLDLTKVAAGLRRIGLGTVADELDIPPSHILDAAFAVDWQRLRAEHGAPSPQTPSETMHETQHGMPERAGEPPAIPISDESVRMSSIPTEHAGQIYTGLLQALCERHRIAHYLEVGVFTGANLCQISCDVAVAVDPTFKIEHNIAAGKRRVHIVQETSDRFFASDILQDVFPLGFDLAFLDGLHWAEYLLRDFMGAEKGSHPRSFITMHDCLPLNHEMADRRFLPAEERSLDYKNYWTGDIWKVIPILKKYRPDLAVDLYDAFPTGLAIIYNLDRSSTVLHDNRLAIADEMMAMGNDTAAIEEFWSQQTVLSAANMDVVKSEHRLFRF